MFSFILYAPGPGTPVCLAIGSLFAVPKLATPALCIVLRNCLPRVSCECQSMQPRSDPHQLMQTSR